jgi:hypothetical protein
MELDITNTQALFLNRLARNASNYRIAAERIAEDLGHSLKRLDGGNVPSPLRHQDVSEVIRYQAMVEAMDEVVYTVFPFPEGPYETEEDAIKARRSHEKLVGGFIKTAATLDRADFIMAKIRS